MGMQFSLCPDYHKKCWQTEKTLLNCTYLMKK